MAALLAACLPVSAEVSTDGLHESGGIWQLDLGGEIASGYTGLYNDASFGWWLVTNGVVNFDYTGLWNDPNYGWWLIYHGTVAWGFTGLWEDPNYGWWLIRNAQVCFDYNGVWDDASFGSWVIENGQPIRQAEATPAVADGLHADGDGWHLYLNGQIASGYSGLYGDPVFGWWLVENGAVNFNRTGLYCDPSLGWWLLNGGAVDFGYTGLYGDETYGWWLLDSGTIAWGYNALYEDAAFGTWLVRNGAIAFDYSGPWDDPVLGNISIKDGRLDDTPAPVPAGSGKVGVSMPTNSLQRWAQDGGNMEKGLKDAGYEVDLQFADNDIPTQVAQIEAMIDNGCEVIIVACIEGTALNEALAKAKEKGIKIIAYDRLPMDTNAVDYYTTFDNYMVGAVQGAYVKEYLNLDSNPGPFYIEFTAGDPGDNNAALFYQGALDQLKKYIDAGKLVVRSGQINFANVATLFWMTDTAQKRAEDILSAYYANGEKLDAWLCSNDSTALGITNALSHLYAGGNWPIITGQDCDLENVRNILAGKQSMSVFKDTRTLVDRAVTITKQILSGAEVEVNDTETYNNNVITVPAFLCTPSFVDANNYREFLIDSGYYTEDMLK